MRVGGLSEVGLTCVCSRRYEQQHPRPTLLCLNRTPEGNRIESAPQCCMLCACRAHARWDICLAASPSGLLASHMRGLLNVKGQGTVDVCCSRMLQGLEAALEAAAAAAEEADEAEEEDETAELRTSATAAVVSAGLQSLSAAAGTGTSTAGGAPSTDTSAGGGVNGAPAQQPAAAGPSAAPAPLQTQSSVGPGPGGLLYSQPSWQQQEQQPYYHGRVSGTYSHAGRPGRHAQRLTTQEKDVLLVLTAFCKLASREVPGGAASSDSVLAQGKLLALEMLAKVRQHHPLHGKNLYHPLRQRGPPLTLPCCTSSAQ